MRHTRRQPVGLFGLRIVKLVPVEPRAKGQGTVMRQPPIAQNAPRRIDETLDRQQPGHGASICAACMLHDRWKTEQDERQRLRALGVPLDRIEVTR